MAFIDSPKKLISRHNKRNSALATNVPGHTRRMEASLISHKYTWGALGILGDPGAASWEDAMFRATRYFRPKVYIKNFRLKISRHLETSRRMALGIYSFLGSAVR